MDAKALAAKLKNLADSGSPGERELAQKRLKEIMKKYHLTESEVVSEEVSYHDIRFRYPWEQKLLWQIGYMVLNSPDSYSRKGPSNRPRKLVLFYCTDAQAAEIEYLFSYYRNLFQKELDTLVSAFVQKHQLFGNSIKVPSEEPNEEELAKLWAMYATLDDGSPRKAIEQKG